MVVVAVVVVLVAAGFAWCCSCHIEGSFVTVNSLNVRAHRNYLVYSTVIGEFSESG